MYHAAIRTADVHASPILRHRNHLLSNCSAANNTEALSYLRKAATDSPTPGPLRRRVTVDVLQSPPGSTVSSPVPFKDRRRSELDRLDMESNSSPSAGRKGVSFNLDASTYEDPASGISSARSESPFKQQAGVSAGGILSSWSAGHSTLVGRSGSAGKNRSNSPLSMRPAADTAAMSAGSEYKLPPLGKQQGCQGNNNSGSIRNPFAAGTQQSAGMAAGSTSPPGKASPAVSPTGPKVISGSHSHIRPVNNHKTGYKTQSLGFKPRIAPVGLINERAAMAACELDSTRYDKILGKLDKEVVAADQRVYAKQQRRASSSSEQSEGSLEQSEEEL